MSCSRDSDFPGIISTGHPWVAAGRECRMGRLLGAHVLPMYAGETSIGILAMTLQVMDRYTLTRRRLYYELLLVIGNRNTTPEHPSARLQVKSGSNPSTPRRHSLPLARGQPVLPCDQPEAYAPQSRKVVARVSAPRGRVGARLPANHCHYRPSQITACMCHGIRHLRQSKASNGDQSTVQSTSQTCLACRLPGRLPGRIPSHRTSGLASDCPPSL